MTQFAEHEGNDPWAAGGKAEPLSKDKRQPRGNAAKRDKAPSKFNWRDVSMTAAELRKTEFDEVRWIIPGFLPEGATVLAAKPKVGKSWLKLDWGIAVATGGTVFDGYKNIQARQGDALILALEDNERRLKGRIDKLGLIWPERLTLTTQWPRSNEGGIEALEDWCKSVENPSFIGIDTFAKFRPPGNAKTSAYDQDYSAIAPIKALADKYKLAALILHHLRKGQSDDPFDTVSGTLGLTGSADTIIVIERRTSGLIMCMRGRDVSDEELAMKFNKDRCRWEVMGNAAAVQKSYTETTILTALTGVSDSEGLSPKEILLASGLTIKRNALDQAIYRMAKNGLVQRVGRGKYALLSDPSDSSDWTSRYP